MMIDRLAGNAALKDSVRLMLGSRRLTHSVLLVGETGLGAGYAARCVAADYLYPAGGAPAEALLRGECCRAVGKAGDRDSGRIETGVVRETISVTGMGSGGRYLVSQVKAMRTEIFNTSLSAEGRAVLLYHVERMNEESANALLKVMEEPPEGVLCWGLCSSSGRRHCAASGRGYAGSSGSGRTGGELQMMIDRLAGNAALKDSVRLMLGSRRLTHSVLLVGETGLGAGYAARCVAADYLYPAGGAPAEALLRGECCRAVGKAGDRDSGRIETGVVREAISVTGMGSGGRYLVSQVKAMRTEIFNTSLSAEGRAVLLYHVERMNEESANALLKVMEEPPEGVLFLLTADSLAGVLPTIRSRCISFAVAPVSPEECARWCIGQGVDKKQARLYSELFDGHIGTVLAAARDDARREQVEKALTLAKAAAAQDSYAAAVLLAGYEKDKAAAAALLGDFRAVAAAGLRGCASTPLTGDAARRALSLADAAIQRLAAQVNPKITLSVLAAKLG